MKIDPSHLGSDVSRSSSFSSRSLYSSLMSIGEGKRFGDVLSSKLDRSKYFSGAGSGCSGSSSSSIASGTLESLQRITSLGEMLAFRRTSRFIAGISFDLLLGWAPRRRSCSSLQRSLSISTSRIKRLRCSLRPQIFP